MSSENADDTLPWTPDDDAARPAFRDYGVSKRPDVKPSCQNCESQLTARYARVFTPDDAENPRVCINCEDIIRDGNGFREARSSRGNKP